MYKVLDLFCGCGGMSWGLHNKGFKVIAGIDILNIALETFKFNHQKAAAYNLDLSLVNPKDIMKMLVLEQGELDVLIGGPPCQGFSKNTPASWRFLDDPQNQLFRVYLNFVECLMPKVAIIENVAEIYNAYGGTVRDEIVNKLKSLGYKVRVSIIDMSEYGIPQRRRRCIFLRRERVCQIFLYPLIDLSQLGMLSPIYPLLSKEKVLTACRIQRPR